MVLVLNGVLQDECPMNTNSLFMQHPVYRDTATQFLSIPTKTVGAPGLLYVCQREMAAVAPHDKNVNIIGSDDATTCVIVVVRHSESFHKHPLEIDLTQACVGELNTILRGDINWPIIYGIGVNMKTGEIFPATFPDKGPDLQLRLARHFTGGQQVLDIYDSTVGMLRIGPFNYDPLRGVDLWLSQSDEFILQHLSTSPEVEPPHFAMQVRATLRYIQDNQFPAVTVFRNNNPHYFRRDEATGCWIPVRF